MTDPTDATARRRDHLARPTRRAVVGALSLAGSALPLAAVARSTSGRGAAQPPKAAEPQPPTLAIGPASVRLRPAPAAEVAVWSLGGSVPAPTLRTRRGERLDLAVDNRLAIPAALLWHGLRGNRAVLDGDGLPVTLAAGRSTPLSLEPPDAGTFLYRPLLPGGSGELQDRGLTGMLVVEEETPPFADLDLAVLVDDWLLGDDGAVAPFDTERAAMTAGRLGNWLTVNGGSPPHRFSARPGSRLRIRLANACNARIMRLRFDGLRPFVLAVDGQPTDTFEPLRASLPFAPGTRYDLMVDLPADNLLGGTIVAEVGAGVPLLRIVGEGRPPARPAPPPIAPLPPNRLLPERLRLQDAVRAALVIEGGARPGSDGRLDTEGVDPAAPWRVNAGLGKAGMEPVLRVPSGRPAVIAVTNRTAWMQVLHLHGHAARLLHPVDDGWEPYWLDTVSIPAGRTLTIAFEAGERGRWPITSTVTERFDAGLWTMFEVV